MFESLVILMREGVEAALVIGIALVALERSGRRDLARPVWWGVAAAVLASLVAAAGIDRLPISGEAYEGALYWTAALFVGTMLVWMHRSSKRLRADIETRLERAASSGETWGLGVFAFFMVFREGAETVLFLSAIRLTTDGMMMAAGAAIGLAIAIVFGVMFVRGSVRVDLRRFFFVTECVLVLFLAQLLVNGYHEFGEAGVVPATRTTMAMVGPIVRNDGLFLLALVAIPIFIWGSKSSGTASLDGLGEADRRLAVARARRDRFYRYGAIATALFVLASVGVAFAQDRKPRRIDPPAVVEATGDAIRLPAAGTEDGVLRRYLWEPSGVRFFVVKTDDGKIRTAFDACEICGPQGYVQEGSLLLCLNCEAEIVPVTVGLPGGCNPVPLESSIEGADLVIPVAALEAGAKWFQDAANAESECVVCGMGIPGGTDVCKMKSCQEKYAADPEKFTK